MKYALDTSVLVRILVNMPQPLASEVIADVARRIAAGDTMVVPNLVLSEAYYAVQPICSTRPTLLPAPPRWRRSQSIR